MIKLFSVILRSAALRRVSKDDRAAAVVEFALVTPLLVYLLIGLVDVGRYMYYGIVAEHAARSGVQYGAQTVYTAKDSTGISSVATTDGTGLALVATSSIECVQGGGVITCPSPATAVPTNLAYYIQVQVTGTFHPLIVYPGIPSSVPITATAVSRLGSQ